MSGRQRLTNGLFSSWLSFLALLVLLGAAVLPLGGTTQALAGPVPNPPDLQLIQVLPSSAADLDRFEAIGLPAYARLAGRSGETLLTGTDAAGRQALASAGLATRVLDPRLATAEDGPAYYLAFPMPGRPAPDWSAYGDLLLDDGVQLLLRTSPERAEALSRAGAEIQRLTLTAKPLRPAAPQQVVPTVVEPDPLVQLMIDQVVSTTVEYYDGGLSGEWAIPIGGQPYLITTRYTYSGEPIQKTTQFAGERFASLGLDVEYHQWGGPTYPNVIGEIPGLINPDDIYILCAHVDDVQGTPGADDNASGSVAVLMAAEILSQFQWGCTLRFALWTGEEQGLNGSEAYAYRAYQEGENILGVLNLDMIAYNSIGSAPGIDLHATTSIPDTQLLAQLFSDVVDAYELDLDPQIIPNGTGASDHASFWQYGYTAILGIEDDGDFNPYYHQPGDLLSNMDLDYFTEFVQASLASFVHMNSCLIPSGIGHLDGHVTAASGGSPIAGASLVIEDDGGHTFAAVTDGNGYYTRTLLSGTYTVTASAYGFLPQTAGGVVVVTDTVTTQDLALDTAPEYVVSGTVSEAGTGLPLLAQVTFQGAPVTVWTDPASGYYEAAVAEGSYTMRVRADMHMPEEREVVVDHDQTQDFALEPLPCVLLVDDDGNDPDVRSYYTAALDDLGVDYNVWDLPSQGDPAADDLYGYQMVFWFTGYPWGNTFNSTNEDALTAYLDGGGSFFLSSQDYLYDFGLTAFGQDYLHIASYNSDEEQTTVTGQNPYAGLGPYSLSYPFTNYSDIVSPDGQGMVAFVGNQGNAAVAYDGDSFNTVFLGFPFEAIPNLAGRSDVMSATLAFFGSCGAESGRLAGQVTDAASGDPLAGAEVTVMPSARGTILATTNPNGHYTLTLPVGAYDVTAAKEGYLPQTALDVAVEVGMTTTQDFALEPILAPAIVISPTALSAALQPGGLLTLPLHIDNAGNADLVFTLTEAPAVDWLAESPGGGTLPPAGTTAVSVTFDAAGLLEGTYTTTLEVQSNDPTHAVIIVPVTLEVRTPCEEIYDADFAWLPVRPISGTEVTFSAAASGTPPISFTWDLGDGTPADGMVVTHTYTASGTYTVTLTLANACSTEMVIHPVTVAAEWSVYLPLVLVGSERY